MGVRLGRCGGGGGEGLWDGMEVCWGGLGVEGGGEVEWGGVEGRRGVGLRMGVLWMVGVRYGGRRWLGEAGKSEATSFRLVLIKAPESV